MAAVAARDEREFYASIMAFEDCLCEEALKILAEVWYTSRSIVPILVLCRLFYRVLFKF